jgi:hypothetical protein
VKLAKAGYCGGDPEKVLKARVDLVMEMYQYENFVNKYEKVWMELNKNGEIK